MRTDYHPGIDGDFASEPVATFLGNRRRLIARMDGDLSPESAGGEDGPKNGVVENGGHIRFFGGRIPRTKLRNPQGIFPRLKLERKLILQDCGGEDVPSAKTPRIFLPKGSMGI
jgi:hypothetical protein